jgi:hypothetical protein
MSMCPPWLRPPDVRNIWTLLERGISKNWETSRFYRAGTRVEIGRYTRASLGAQSNSSPGV